MYTYAHSHAHSHIHTCACTYMHIPQMCTHMYRYTHSHICTLMYIHGHVHTCACTHRHDHRCALRCTHVHTSMFALSCTHICMATGVHSHVHMCTLTHMHSHAPFPRSSWPMAQCQPLCHGPGTRGGCSRSPAPTTHVTTGRIRPHPPAGTSNQHLLQRGHSHTQVLRTSSFSSMPSTPLLLLFSCLVVSNSWRPHGL